jgi:hypothetical protein
VRKQNSPNRNGAERDDAEAAEHAAGNGLVEHECRRVMLAQVGDVCERRRNERKEQPVAVPMLMRVTACSARWRSV